MSTLTTGFDALASAYTSGPDSTPMPPPSGPIGVHTVLGYFRGLLWVLAAGAAVAIVVFAVRTVTFSGAWKESITAGPARRLLKAIVFLAVSVGAIELLDWVRGDLS